MELNSAQINLDLYLDWKLFSLAAIVSFITGNILIYRQTYINSDKYKKRFTLILSLFAISIIWTTLTSKNIIPILIGWDFLGLTSLLLIIHYQSKYVYSFGIITFILNRIGDIGFIIAGAYYLGSGSWSIFTLTERQTYIIILLSIAGFTKRAQIPFSSWLPKAIAAPTPVSALVHSSTLVTAGVILLIQIDINLNYRIKLLLLLISILTIFISRLAAIIEHDLKKIIAFSTIRQIRLIIIILLIGNSNLAFFHLLTHALFKSLIFIGAGTIIHHTENEQDIRKINNIRIKLPLETFIINLSILALIGFPFYSGFYSKDLIIEFYNLTNINLIIIIIVDLSICITSIYSTRLAIYLCWSKTYKNYLFNWETSSQEKTIILIFRLPIIISGAILSWLFIKNFYLEVPIIFYLKTFGLWRIFCSILLTLFIILNYHFKLNKTIQIFFNSIFFIDHIISFFIILTIILRTIYHKYVETLWIKFLTINLKLNVKNSLKINQIFNYYSIIKNTTLFIILLLIILYI